MYHMHTWISRYFRMHMYAYTLREYLVLGILNEPRASRVFLRSRSSPLVLLILSKVNRSHPQMKAKFHSTSGRNFKHNPAATLPQDEAMQAQPSWLIIFSHITSLLPIKLLIEMHLVEISMRHIIRLVFKWIKYCGTENWDSPSVFSTRSMFAKMQSRMLLYSHNCRQPDWSKRLKR